MQPSRIVDGELVELTAEEVAAIQAAAQAPKAAWVAQRQRLDIQRQLAALDAYIPRGLEDSWAASGFDVTTLPQVQRDRLAQKQALRSQLAALPSGPSNEALSGS